MYSKARKNLSPSVFLNLKDFLELLKSKNLCLTLTSLITFFLWQEYVFVSAPFLLESVTCSCVSTAPTWCACHILTTIFTKQSTRSISDVASLPVISILLQSDLWNGPSYPFPLDYVLFSHRYLEGNSKCLHACCYFLHLKYLRFELHEQAHRIRVYEPSYDFSLDVCAHLHVKTEPVLATVEDNIDSPPKIKARSTLRSSNTMGY